MSYVLHEEYSITDFDGGPMDAEGFAIHWWGDPTQRPTFWNIVNVLIERARLKQASVNFVAEADLVACLISPTTIAWAQGDGGDGWGNRHLVSIECNPRCTAEDRETVAELMADTHIKAGTPLVAFPHKKFTNTQCPGVWEQWIPWLVSRAKQIVAEKQGVKPAPAPVAPKPVPAPVHTPVQGNGSGPGYCIVESGDTLSGIAAQFGKSLDRIIGLNPGIDPDRIEPGQTIYLLNHCFVESGDTLTGIAEQFGFSLAAVMAANPGIDYDRLTPGQVIYLE